MKLPFFGSAANALASASASASATTTAHPAPVPARPHGTATAAAHAPAAHSGVAAQERASAVKGAASGVPPAPTFAAPLGATAAPPRRRKLWDIEEKHHCPVIGTCVPLDELVRFAKRFRFTSALRDEFALHVEAVNRSLERSEFAETLHKHLDRKYAAAVKRFDTARDDEEVRALWRGALTRGDVAAALWATLTHKHASAATRHIAYADLHMLSHQVGAGLAADARRLATLKKDSAEQRRALAEEQRGAAHREAALNRRVEQLAAEVRRLAGIEREADALRSRVAGLESGEVIVGMGRRIASLEHGNQRLIVDAQRAAELEKALAAARADAAQLATRHAAERDQLAAERDALERMLLADDACEGDCATGCPRAGEHAPGAEPRNVLCVGGRTALLAQYRNLAQRLGIRLVHHDGGQEEALSRLPDMIAGADAVICPTDCVSHSAYYQLKNQCRRSGKPCLLFKGAGVSSFALALARLSAGQVSLPAAAPPH